ncbi:MAG: cell division protein FtsQ/DivIB [Candidatus Glassbacteria bacterium]
MRSRVRRIRRRVRGKSKRSRSLYILLFTAAMSAGALSWVFLNTSLCEVQRIHIHGVNFGYPEDLLLESGIEAGINIFSNLSRYEHLLSAHPLVVEAHIDRHPPRTLSVRVEEREPFAFIKLTKPVPVSRNGILLPEDRIAVELDLPLLTIEGGGGVSQGAVMKGLGFLSRLEAASPALFNLVSELLVKDSVPSILYLRSPKARVLLGDRFTLLSSRLLTGVLTELGRDDGFYEIDLRFNNQAVVRQLGEDGKHSLYDSI